MGIKLKKIALYPGTFDPITNGHFDIIERALKLFDEVVVAVAISADKKPIFSLEDRIMMAKKALKHLDNVRVIGFDNLTVDLAESIGATILIRGLRALSDFEYELQLGYLNTSLNDTIETVYLMPVLKHTFISSSIVRNLLKFNARTDHLVPPEVEKILQEIKASSL